MEQQRAEPVDARLERRLAIGLPEEPRVAQPRRDDALGVARDRALVVRLGVDDREKRVLQPAVLALDRKVVLMVNQRRRQHFFRQLEELDARTCRRRPTGIRRDRAPRASRPESPRTTRLTRPCRRCALASSSRAILLWRSLRSRMTKFSSSRARYSSNDAHLDGAAGAAARRQEAMAVGDRARRHVLHLAGLRRRRARDRERHDAAAVDEQDPADRPAEQQLAAAVVEHRVPVHQLRERQPAQRAAEHVRQHVDRRLAALLLPEGEVRALSASRRARAPTPRRPASRQSRRRPASACRRP